MNTIVNMVFGSHLYGTNTKNSDKDYKGIFLPTHNDCYLNNVPKSISSTTGKNNSKNTNNDVDREIYSLQYFINLALQGQTVAIDMIHAPKNMIIESNWIWDDIVRHRRKFYTKNLKAFIGYARKQAAKYGIKGSRLDSVLSVLNFLKENDYNNRLYDIWNKLPILEHTHIYNIEDKNMYQVCGKLFQSTVKVGYVIPILEKFYQEYGSRAELAKKNKGIDWKACSHAMRAATQVKELLTNNEIIFPLYNAKYLTEIKVGNIDYTQYAESLESIIEEVEILSKESSLPDKADSEWWNNFIIDVYNSIV